MSERTERHLFFASFEKRVGGNGPSSPSSPSNARWNECRGTALVKPLPPKAVAGRPDFTRAKCPRLLSPPAHRWAAIQDLALAPSLSPGDKSPIRNSIEPFFWVLSG
jgi:hypothetical protein